MNTRALRSVLCLVPLAALAVACSGGEGAPPPSSSTSTARPPAYPSGAPSASDDAGVDASATPAPLPTDPPLCAGAAWKGGARVRGGPADLGSLAGLTPLGRMVAWLDTSGRLLVADRADSSSEFGDAVPVDTASPSGRAALHPAGALLFATNASRSGLVVYTRLYRKDPWAGPSTTGLSALSAQLATLGATIEDMTIGGTPGSLFLLLSVGGARTLYEATFDPSTGGWGRAVAHNEIAVASMSGAVRRPTGLSWDARTLFFYDEGASVTRAAFRGATTGTFDTVVDVGAFPGALPSQTCSVLYYVGHDNDGAGLFTVAR
jgi:hypothetical protein